MKKLMIAAAVAATSVAAFAESAQVYDVALSIKTTAAKGAKNIKNSTNPRAWEAAGGDIDYMVYRAQATQTWKGYIWGCDCETIEGIWQKVGANDGVGGTIVWDTKSKEVRYFGYGANVTDPTTAPGCGWGWDFINAIDKSGAKVEGVWNMIADGDTACQEDVPLFSFTGAGFGTIKDVYDVTEICDDPDACSKAKSSKIKYVTCGSYISAISGNFAGWMIAPDSVVDGKDPGCWFCEKKGDDDCKPSEAWEYCTACGDSTIVFDPTRTAAYGTWSIKYNSSASKKLRTGKNITDVISFKKLPDVDVAIATAALATLGELPVEECDELKEALDNAQKAYNDATEAIAMLDQKVLDAQYAKAKEDLEESKAAVVTATAGTNAAQIAYNAAAAVRDADYFACILNGNNWDVFATYKGASAVIAGADELLKVCAGKTVCYKNADRIVCGDFTSFSIDNKNAAVEYFQGLIDTVTEKETALVEANRSMQVADEGLVFAEQAVKDLEWTKDPAKVALAQAKAAADQAAKLVDLKAAQAAWLAAGCDKE